MGISVRLIRAVRVLGRRLGVRYWQIENACIRDPVLILDWAARCEISTVECLRKGDLEIGFILMDWAARLKASRTIYEKT